MSVKFFNVSNSFGTITALLPLLSLMNEKTKLFTDFYSEMVEKLV